jgi:hypothetical protein
MKAVLAILASLRKNFCGVAEMKAYPEHRAVQVAAKRLADLDDPGRFEEDYVEQEVSTEGSTEMEQRVRHYIYRKHEP